MVTQEQRELSFRGQFVDASRRAWQDYGIGRYDENRQHMYSSSHFDDTSNDIDGFAGARTLHIGIDLDGPLYTSVHTFWHGTIHAIGYNPELGDYGHVLVIRHELPPAGFNEQSDDDKRKGKTRTVYALYGHLSNPAKSGVTRFYKVGDKVHRGQCVGNLGDVHDNGGWLIPHVHFQLALEPPATHDMPGAVTMADRAKALVLYPDPRYILGPLH